MATVFQAIAPRPAPIKTSGFVPWVRRNLFGDWKSVVTTAILAILAVRYLPEIANWAIFQAVFHANASECSAARGTGACWGVIAEKYRFIIFGRYPYDQQWRPELATVLMVSLLMVSCTRRFWRPWLAPVWVAVLAVYFLLMRGGALGLSYVPTDQWGGLPLTVMLATLGIAFAFPLALLVAL
ncbi:MAG: hypothetical protein ABIQ84_10075, partial [Usitatibacter sp.]